MTNTSHTTPAAATATAPSMRSEISQKWSKLTAADISALKTNEDLVAQVQSKYSFDKAHAQREVDGFAKGRQL